MLREHDTLTAWQLAGAIYVGERDALRRATYRISDARLWATRRTLRRLIGKGRVIVTGRYRRRKVYALVGGNDRLANLVLGALE